MCIYACAQGQLMLFEFPQATNVVGEEVENNVSSHAISEIDADTHAQMRTIALEDPVRGPAAIGDDYGSDFGMPQPLADQEPSPKIAILEEHWKELTVKVRCMQEHAMMQSHLHSSNLVGMYAGLQIAECMYVFKRRAGAIHASSWL